MNRIFTRQSQPRRRNRPVSSAWDHPGKPGMDVPAGTGPEPQHRAVNLRLGHVHLRVRDLSRSVPFYAFLLGLRLTEQVGRFAFLAFGEEHHSIALEELGAWAIRPPRRALYVGHVAFEVGDAASFEAMGERLREHQVPFIGSNNGTNWALDFRDPDQHHLQVFLDRRFAPGGTPFWRGLWYGPLWGRDQKTEGQAPV